MDSSESDEPIEHRIKPEMSNEPNSSRLASIAWKHFNIIAPDSKLASCNICKKILCFRSSVSNLTKHYKKVHRGTSDESEKALNYNSSDESSENTPKQKTDRKRSPVWYYFKTLDPVLRIAMCHICKRRLSYTTVSNLSKHLKRRHPNATVTKVKDGTEIMLGADGQFYEIESKSSESEQHDEHDPDLDPIYLDEFEDFQNSDESIPSKKRKIDYKNTSETSSNEVIYKIPVTKEPDTLAHFANYITALLRELPKTISDQLQADIVKQILAAKVSTELTNTGTVIPNNSYSKTFNNETDSTNDENENEDSRAMSNMCSYFEAASGGKMRCVVCRATCANIISSLKEHLEDKHSKLLADIMQSTDIGSESEGEQADNTYTEIVYLEDEVKESPKRKEKPKKIPNTTPLPKKRTEKRKDSSSSDDLPVKKHKNSTSNDEELDSFIKYITCLLKQVPKHVFSKVQMDIVNIIMNSKLQAQNNIIIEHVPSQEPMQVIVNLDNGHERSNSDVKPLRNETIMNVATHVPSLDCNITNTTND